jgi:crossover junction endodeoxyribonuclease RuvC
MGIDPGTANLGFGVIRIEGGQMSPLDGGVIETDSASTLEERLKKIYEGLTELIEWHRPAGIALEEVYFGRNVDSAMKVGQASGVAMLAGAQKGVECFTYTPQAIKKAVCGSGDAGKKQVQKMVGVLLGLKETPKPDHAADALAVAICHGGSDGLRGAARAAGVDPGDRSLRVAS